MTIRQRIQNLLSTGSQHRCRSHQRDQHNHNTANMSKRQRSESPRIDLDEKLRPYKQHRPRTPTTTNDEKIDHENEMDNWYISSRDSEKQKGSTDRLERGAWDSRHRLDPSEISDKAAGWHYFQDGNNYRREWVANVVAPSPMKRITRRTRSLNLQGGPNRSFQANHGDKEISALYWKYWMENDKEKFISVIYQYGHPERRKRTMSDSDIGNMRKVNGYQKRLSGRSFVAWCRNLCHR